MKLLTAVIAPNRLPGVTAALDHAGIPATVVGTAQASRLEGGAKLEYRGVGYRDQRCVRIEILLRDPDLELAVDTLKLSGGHADGGLTVWASDVDDLVAHGAGVVHAGSIRNTPPLSDSA